MEKSKNEFDSINEKLEYNLALKMLKLFLQATIRHMKTSPVVRPQNSGLQPGKDLLQWTYSAK